MSATSSPLKENSRSRPAPCSGFASHPEYGKALSDSLKHLERINSLTAKNGELALQVLQKDHEILAFKTQIASLTTSIYPQLTSTSSSSSTHPSTASSAHLPPHSYAHANGNAFSSTASSSTASSSTASFPQSTIPFVPDPQAVKAFQREVQNYHEPVYDAAIHGKVTNWNSVVTTGLQAACLDLDGIGAPRPYWTIITTDRRKITKALLDPLVGERDQPKELYDLAVKVLEARHPILSYGKRGELNGVQASVGSWKTREAMRNVLANSKKYTKKPEKPEGGSRVKVEDGVEDWGFTTPGSSKRPAPSSSGVGTSNKKQVTGSRRGGVSAREMAVIDETEIAFNEEESDNGGDDEEEDIFDETRTNPYSSEFFSIPTSTQAYTTGSHDDATGGPAPKSKNSAVFSPPIPPRNPYQLPLDPSTRSKVNTTSSSGNTNSISTQNLAVHNQAPPRNYLDPALNSKVITRDGGGERVAKNGKGKGKAPERKGEEEEMTREVGVEVEMSGLDKDVGMEGVGEREQSEQRGDTDDGAPASDTVVSSLTTLKKGLGITINPRIVTPTPPSVPSTSSAKPKRIQAGTMLSIQDCVEKQFNLANLISLSKEDLVRIFKSEPTLPPTTPGWTKLNKTQLSEKILKEMEKLVATEGSGSQMEL